MTVTVAHLHNCAATSAVNQSSTMRVPFHPSSAQASTPMMHPAEQTSQSIMEMTPTTASQSDLVLAEETLRQALNVPVQSAAHATQRTALVAKSIHRLAQIHAHQGNHSDASRLYSQILVNCASIHNLSPLVLATAWYDVGLLCLASQEPQKAIVAFQQAFGVPSLIGSAGTTPEDSTAVLHFVSNAMKQVEGLLDSLEGRQSVLAMIVGRRLPWSIELVGGLEQKQQQQEQVPATQESPSMPNASACQIAQQQARHEPQHGAYEMDSMFSWAAGAA